MASEPYKARPIAGIQLDDLIEGERYVVEQEALPKLVGGIYRGLERGVGGKGQIALELTGGRYKRIPVAWIIAINQVRESTSSERPNHGGPPLSY